MKQYFVYIASSISGVIYVGVTNDLERRMFEHKNKLVSGFTSDYNVNKLAYFKNTPSVMDAITREKEIKGWNRSKKIELVESVNPTWKDLLPQIPRLRSG